LFSVILTVFINILSRVAYCYSIYKLNLFITAESWGKCWWSALG